MRALKFVRNLVTRCVALLAIIVPVPKAAGQTPHTEGVKTVLPSSARLHRYWPAIEFRNSLFSLLPIYQKVASR